MLGPKVILCALLTLCVSHVAALDFANSRWIWMSEDGATTAPASATADFRRDFAAPFGKIPVSANIIIAADSNYTLYVNGELIGQGYNLRESQGYCVKLGHNPAAFITAINVTYTDGTSTIIVSDASWRANNETAGFESVDFDYSAWPYAVVVVNEDSPPLGEPSLRTSASNWPQAFSLLDIHNNEILSPTAFRKTYKVSGGSLVQSGTIIIDTDNGYTLYINGKEIGSGDNWPQAQRWPFTLEPTDNIVLAIIATNAKGPAGFIVAVALDGYYHDCSSTLVKVVDGAPDGSWKFNLAVPAGFEQPGYDDSSWPSIVVKKVLTESLPGAPFRL